MKPTSGTSSRYARINEIFQGAIDLAPAECASFLERECGADGDLRREVEAFLAADAQPDDLLETPVISLPADLLAEDDQTSFAGRALGHYRVIRELGRGGLGSVYLAARADDAYRKEVAIKLIRRGLDTEDILQRFRNERQILAQLDHANIARLIDGGTTDDGLPYFVMDYVKGEPLGAYCDSHKLDTRRRLELFRKVCAAVTYAHQNLVVHRDLKPSNILVAEDGEPKLLDFGIARLLTAENELLALTLPGMRAMTPDYASPEQVKGEKITTASDVYSLGVLLYELLSGEKPYRLTTGTVEEISRAVAEQEPPRQRMLPPELNNIVGMAMRKELGRRYASVEQFSEDIRRYLEQRPIIARKDTIAYRAGKFVRRNKLLVAAAILVLFALAAGMVATWWQARIAHAERARAERRFNDVRKLANSNLFDVYPEIENLAGSLKAREKILQNALTYLDSLAQEATGDSELQSELATAYEKVGDVQGALNTSSLGQVQAGLDSYGKAARLRRAVLTDHPSDLTAKKQLANNIYVTARTLWNNSQTTEAEKAFAQTIRLQRELVAAQPEAAELKNQLAVTLIDYGAIPVFNFQTAKALPLFDEGLAIIQSLRQKNPDDAELKKTRARGLRILSKARAALGDHAGGLEALHEAHALSRELARQFPQDFRLQRSVWLTETMICELFIDQGDGAEALRNCGKTIEFPRAALQNEPNNGVVAFDLAISHFNNARANRLAADFPATITQAEAAISVMSTLSAKTPQNSEYQRNLAIYRTELARAQLELGQPAAALGVLDNVREALELIVQADPGSTTYRYDLGSAHRLAAQASYRSGDKDTARKRIEQAAIIFKQLREQEALRDSDQVLLQELEQERAEYSR